MHVCFFADDTRMHVARVAAQAAAGLSQTTEGMCSGSADWSYDGPAVTEKMTHDTPEKKKRRTNRDNWASSKRVFKPHQEIKEKARTNQWSELS
jgi:hypothetical protein